jgi:hypothetical protein
MRDQDEHTTNGDRDLERGSRIAGVLPWLSALAVVLSAIHIRLGLGYWPRVYRDSADFPLADTATVVTAFAVLSWPAMVCVGVLLPIVRARSRARPVVNRGVVSCWIGTLVLWLLATKDPYGFVEWAFD